MIKRIASIDDELLNLDTQYIEFSQFDWTDYEDKPYIDKPPKFKPIDLSDVEEVKKLLNSATWSDIVFLDLVISNPPKKVDYVKQAKAFLSEREIEALQDILRDHFDSGIWGIAALKKLLQRDVVVVVGSYIGTAAEKYVKKFFEQRRSQVEFLGTVRQKDEVQDAINKAIQTWIQCYGSPIDTLKQAAREAKRHDYNNGWYVGDWNIEVSHVPHRAKDIEKVHCDAIKALLNSSQIPYEIEEGKLTASSALFHDGIVAATESPEASDFRLDTIFSVAALALAREGKKLQPQNPHGRLLLKRPRLSQRGINVIKENGFDFGDELHRFFDSVIEHDDSGDQALQPTYNIVEVKWGGHRYRGINFVFKEWPLEKKGGEPLSDAVKNHIDSYYASGRYGARHTGSRHLAKCVCEGGWTVLRKMKGATPEVLCEPSAEPFALLSFTDSGLRFMGRTD